jgi:hypothetical protein
VEHHSKKSSCAISSSNVWQQQRLAKEMIVMRVDLSSLSSSSSMVLTMSQKQFYSYGILPQMLAEMRIQRLLIADPYQKRHEMTEKSTEPTLGANS